MEMMLYNEKEMKEIKGTFFAGPTSAWDPRFGYRFLSEENRVLRASRGEIVADRKYKLNNYGQNCSFDYTPRKKTENIYRLVVVGDSFTNDFLLHHAWPETLHWLLNSRKEFGIGFEVYSFPTDGGGLVNWHATVKEVINAEFDYDCLIIADWGNDIERSWVMSYSTEKDQRWLSVKPEERPRTQQEFEALLSRFTILYGIKSKEWVEEFSQRLKKNARPQPVTPAECLDGREGAELPPDGYQFSREAFIKRYGELRYSMLEEMVGICKSGKKDVIYSTLPTRQGLICLQNDGKKLMAQAQGEGLSKHFGIHYFDGFDAFKDVDSQALIDFYWLKYDGHWNLGAATHYALKLASWFFQTKPFLKNP